MPQLITDLNPLAAKPPIKVAFFDIDGTLLDKDGRYGPRLAEELARIRGLGVHTAIASGRPHFAAQYLVEELGLTAPGVFCTGAQIYDPANCQVLSCAPITDAVNLALLQRLRQLEVYYELYGQHNFYLETSLAPEVREIHAHHLRRKAVIGPLDMVIPQETVLKWVVGVNKKGAQNSLPMLEREFPQLAFAYAAFPACPDWQFANVIDRQACKKRAFAWLLDYYQVTAEQVVSFGDSHSDEIFLRLAGTGVAMGNASDEVKAVARYVTAPSSEDGVALSLSKLI